MSIKNEKTVKKMYQLLNDRDWRGLNEIIDPKCVANDLQTGQEYKGVDGVKRWLQSWVDTYSDIQAEVKVIASSDTMVVIEGTAHGKNDGQLTLASGETVKATGRKVTMSWVDLVEVKNDRITACRTYYDTGLMMSQLGIGQGQQAAKKHRPAAY